MNDKYSILAEKNEIDDHFLDIIGNEFKFDHEKGLAEWLKNSVDAYIRNSVPDNEQEIILKFTDNGPNSPSIECIDFNGMTSSDINKALKRWGDPQAARKGSKLKVYGGHGNGGKFYMRQMFKTSHYLTFKDGVINIFGFNEKKQYGFAGGFQDKKIAPLNALALANIDSRTIPDKILNKILQGKTGFTVAKGVYPVGMKTKIKVSSICEKLRRHPQAMRLLERTSVQVIHNREVFEKPLKPEEIKPLKGFENPKLITIPGKINYKISGENHLVLFANKKYPQGHLVLKTSEIALTSNSKFAELNRIDIIGELGVIASYPLRELGLYFPQTDFIYGECKCPILEDPSDDSVMNDRSRLANSVKTKALLEWIKNEVATLCESISAEEEKERADIRKKVSSDYNDFLNKWKNNFMNKIFDEIIGGHGNGPGIGVGVGGNQPERSKKSDKVNDNMTKPNENDGGGNESTKGQRYPKVLLSDYDDDPLNPGSKLILQPGHGLVYQRGPDVKHGIYWINTSSPLAAAILKKYDPNSTRWRDYLFQRYIDIFIKEALLTLEKKDPERFNAFTIDGEILGKLVLKVHESAAQDLSSFLFDEKYEIAR